MDTLDAIDVEIKGIGEKGEKCIASAEASHAATLEALYKRRHELIALSSEPNQDELKDWQDDEEGECDGEAARHSAKGSSLFWLTALCNEPEVGEHITARDAAVLQYLEDVRVTAAAPPARGGSLQLVFRSNPCMRQRTVSHTASIVKGRIVEEATDIDWQPGHSPLVREVAAKPKKAKTKSKGGGGGGGGDADAAVRPRYKAAPSFFRTFCRTASAAAPSAPGGLARAELQAAAEEEDEEALLDSAAMLAAIQHSVVPNAHRLFMEDPTTGQELLAGDGEDGEADDFAAGPSPEEAVASLPRLMRRRLAALAANQVACDDVREAHRSKFRGIIADVTSAVAMAAAKRQAVLASPGAPHHFWLRALVAGDVGSQAVHARDHAALGHLTNVRVVRLGSDATGGVTLKMEFEFSGNQFFEDKVLWKALHFGTIPRRTDRQPPLERVTQSGVAWRPGSDLTACGGSFFHLFLPNGAAKAFGVAGKGRSAEDDAAGRLQELLAELRRDTVPRAAAKFREMEDLPLASGSDSDRQDDEAASDDSGEDPSDDEDSAAAAERAARKAQTARSGGKWRITSAGIFAFLILSVLLAQVFIMLAEFGIL